MSKKKNTTTALTTTAPRNLRTRFASESENVSASNEVAVTIFGTLSAAEMPEGAERMNMPPLLKCNQIPIGGIVFGKLVKLVKNFTGKSTMRRSCCLWLNKDGTDFMLPLTGSIRQAFRAYLEVKDEGDKEKLEVMAIKDESIIGDVFYFKRMPDGKAADFGGKATFTFDIVRVKKDSGKRN